MMTIARIVGRKPGGRLQTGAAVMAAARLVDVSVVAARVRAFARMHRDYVDAHRQVEAGVTEVRLARVRRARRSAALAEAVEALARALVGQGHPRRYPFAAFRIGAPSALLRLPAAQQVRAVSSLVADVRSRPCHAAPRRAAEGAEQAAHMVGAALAQITRLETGVRRTRAMRDAIGPRWDMALAALKGDARVAAGDGAPRLFTLLFGAMGRRRKPPSRPPAPARSSEAPASSGGPVAQPGGADLPSRSIAPGIERTRLERTHLRLVMGGRVGAEEGIAHRSTSARSPLARPFVREGAVRKPAACADDGAHASCAEARETVSPITPRGDGS